jgi:hypothetical protein
MCFIVWEHFAFRVYGCYLLYENTSLSDFTMNVSCKPLAIISVKNLRKEKAHRCVFYDADNVLESLVQKGHTSSLLLLILTLHF